MVSKAAISIGLGLGVLALILFARRAKAALPEYPVTYIPAVNEIMAAGSYGELSAYYNLIGELYITGKIGDEQYMVLYNAYSERWYQLEGAS